MAGNEHGIVERALGYAARVHAGQVRKGSQIPYIVHPAEVVAICSRVTDDAETIAAGALLDVVEDTDSSVSDLESLFGTRCALIVAAVSEDRREGADARLTWHERKLETVERLGETMDDAVLIVAMADKLSNMRSTKAGLALVGERHWERFNMHDVSQHAWYMRSLVAVFEPRLGHTIAWHELRDVVEEVFAGV